MTMMDRVRSSVRNRSAALLRRIAKRYLHPNVMQERMPAPCMRCGHDVAFPVNSPVKADFDLNLVPADMREPFRRHDDAICVNCGLYQAYLRYDERQITMINTVGKDELTFDEVYHEYPVPKSYIDAWYGASVERTRARWTSVFTELGLKPRRVLCIRTWFGRIEAMLATEFGCAVDAIDMSPICRRHVSEHYPMIRMLDGELNGRLKGAFLDGPAYDAVIIQHTLIHSIDIDRTIADLRHLVRDGGFVLLAAETKNAPTNPFHKFFPTEYNLTGFLREAFDEVHKIGDEGIIHQDDWRRYTGKATEFIALVRPRDAAVEGR